MKLTLRDNITNEVIVELFDMLEKNLDEQDILKLVSEMDSDILELLQDENYHLSYEKL